MSFAQILSVGVAVFLGLAIWFYFRSKKASKSNKPVDASKPEQKNENMQLVDSSNVTFGGLGIVATTHQPRKLPESTDACIIAYKTNNKKAYDCGHTEAALFTINLYGMESEQIDQNAKCPSCMLEELKKFAIRCVLCGLPILPGEPVALYSGGGKMRTDIATKFEDNYIGCLRWDCCLTAAFFAGHWSEEVFVNAFPDSGNVVQQVMSTGQNTIVNLE